jgi:hypothetical protein
MIRMIGIVVCVFVCQTVSGETWYVDGSVSASGNGRSWETAFGTIQEGITASSDSHTVIVAQGTYVENIRFNGKNITLTGTDPLDLTVIANTVIDGNQAGTVVTFGGTEDASCIITGFTIRNGKAEFGGGICGRRVIEPTHATVKYNAMVDNTADFGGGVYGCDGSILNNAIFSNAASKSGGGLHGCNGTIMNNSVAGNTAVWGGGGLSYCNGTIQDNKIFNNSADGDGGGLYWCGGTIKGNEIKSNSAWDAGGLYSCDGPIRNNTIADNTAIAGGGGLYECDGTIENNTITGNSSAGNAGGLGSCDGAIQYNTITDNLADWRAGGLQNCNGTIRNNLIAGNAATGDDGAGGAMHGCDAPIQNNAIIGNSATSWGGALTWCGGDIRNNTFSRNSATWGGALNNCHGAIDNCIFWENTAPQGAQLYDSSDPGHSCVQDWIGGGEGNIDADPLFADADGPDDDSGTHGDNDYRLTPDSPCIDAGTNSALASPGFDLDGNLRIARWGSLIAIVDMGAYEYNARPFVVREMLFVPAGRRLVWNSQPKDTYSVAMCYNLHGGEWHTIGTISSQGESTSFTDTGFLPWGWRMLFYRVEMQ